MYTTHLRKVGGSVMLPIPPAFLDQLHLQSGEEVGVVVDATRLVIEPLTKPKYSLAQLIEEAQSAAAMEGNPADDPDWVNGAAVGRELL